MTTDTGNAGCFSKKMDLHLVQHLTNINKKY